MTINEPSPESIITSSSDENNNLRRRRSGGGGGDKSVDDVTELDSSSVEASSSSDDVTNDVRDGGIGGLDRVSEAVDTTVEKKISDGDGIQEEKRKVNETTPLKYVYRASAPAHRRNKESPLSSAAIFKQEPIFCSRFFGQVLLGANSRSTKKVCQLPAVSIYQQLLLPSAESNVILLRGSCMIEEDAIYNEAWSL